jgi:transcription-repair coupling factor (superfamily II helicase)
MLAEAVAARRGPVAGAAPAPAPLTPPRSPSLPDALLGASGAKLEMYRRFAAIRSDGDAEQLRGELRDRFGPIPEPVEGLFRAVAVRLAAEAAHVPEVRAESRGVTLKWPRYDRNAVSLALSTAGFRPTLASNQVRIPVAAGRDPVDVAVRALTALTTAR